MSFDLQSQTEYEMYACRFGGVFVYDVVLCLYIYIDEWRLKIANQHFPNVLSNIGISIVVITYNLIRNNS